MRLKLATISPPATQSITASATSVATIIVRAESRRNEVPRADAPRGASLSPSRTSTSSASRAGVSAINTPESAVSTSPKATVAQLKAGVANGASDP